MSLSKSERKSFDQELHDCGLCFCSECAHVRETITLGMTCARMSFSGVRNPEACFCSHAEKMAPGEHTPDALEYVLSSDYHFGVTTRERHIVPPKPDPSAALDFNAASRFIHKYGFCLCSECKFYRYMRDGREFVHTCWVDKCGFVFKTPPDRQFCVFGVPKEVCP